MYQFKHKKSHSLSLSSTMAYTLCVALFIYLLPNADEFLFNVVEVMEKISEEIGKSIPQIAINWLLQNNSVSNIIVGARNEKQLLSNIDSVGWNLSEEHLKELDEISKQTPIYPHWVGDR